MKNIKMLALVSLIFPAVVLADTWAFDTNEKIQKTPTKPLKFEMIEKSASWTFDENDAKVLLVDYDSYAFQ